MATKPALEHETFFHLSPANALELTGATSSRTRELG